MTKQTPDDQKRDEVLLRMLKTPPQPHTSKAERKPSRRTGARTKVKNLAKKLKD